MSASRTLVLALLALGFRVEPVRGEDRPVLTVLNWSWYVEIDEDLDEDLPLSERSPVLRAFEGEFGCEVHYLEFDEEAAMRDLLVGRPEQIDVVNLSPPYCRALHAEGLVRSIDPGLVPNLRNLRDVVVGRIGIEDEVFCVPYFAGNTGVLVNRRLAGPGPFGWREFWDPTSPLTIGLLGGAEGVLGAALLLDGHSISSNDPDELRDAARHVLANLEAGRVGYIGDDVEDVATRVADGELGATILYSSDALGLVGDDVDFVLPAEGVEIFVDCWAISAHTQHSDLAHAFVDFMLRPEIQVRQSLSLDAQVVTNAARTTLLREQSDHPHLEHLVGFEDGDGPTQHMIRRTDTRAAERLWARLLERAAR